MRRKLYLRRLAAQDAARLGAAPPAARGAAGIAGSGGIALLLGQPGQMEAWVDQCLDNMVGGARLRRRLRHCMQPSPGAATRAAVATPTLSVNAMACDGSRTFTRRLSLALTCACPLSSRTASQTPDLLDPSCEDILVNSVSAVAARRLAAAEAGELVRSMQAANKQRNKELASSHGQEIWW